MIPRTVQRTIATSPGAVPSLDVAFFVPLVYSHRGNLDDLTTATPHAPRATDAVDPNASSATGSAAAPIKKRNLRSNVSSTAAVATVVCPSVAGVPLWSLSARPPTTHPPAAVTTAVTTTSIAATAVHPSLVGSLVVTPCPWTVAMCDLEKMQDACRRHIVMSCEQVLSAKKEALRRTLILERWRRQCHLPSPSKPLQAQHGDAAQAVSLQQCVAGETRISEEKHSVDHDACLRADPETHIVVDNHGQLQREGNNDGGTDDDDDGTFTDHDGHPTESSMTEVDGTAAVADDIAMVAASTEPTSVHRPACGAAAGVVPAPWCAATVKDSDATPRTRDATSSSASTVESTSSRSSLDPQQVRVLRGALRCLSPLVRLHRRWTHAVVDVFRQETPDASAQQQMLDLLANHVMKDVEAMLRRDDMMATQAAAAIVADDDDSIVAAALNSTPTGRGSTADKPYPTHRRVESQETTTTATSAATTPERRSTASTSSSWCRPSVASAVTAPYDPHHRRFAQGPSAVDGAKEPHQQESGGIPSHAGGICTHRYPDADASPEAVAGRYLSKAAIVIWEVATQVATLRLPSTTWERHDDAKEQRCPVVTQRDVMREERLPDPPLPPLPPAAIAARCVLGAFLADVQATAAFPTTKHRRSGGATAIGDDVSPASSAASAHHARSLVQAILSLHESLVVVPLEGREEDVVADDNDARSISGQSPTTMAGDRPAGGDPQLVDDRLFVHVLSGIVRSAVAFHSVMKSNESKAREGYLDRLLAQYRSLEKASAARPTARSEAAPPLPPGAAAKLAALRDAREQEMRRLRRLIEQNGGTCA